MPYKALYRKYRPKIFSDVVGQEHITETLKHELASGKIFHAYLFTGTRGTGKTTCAKILSKAVNCEQASGGDPCCCCPACLSIENGDVTDIVEIDAASNNGVEDIRELREQINFTPASVKYRVYIIDEVHMLSTNAFNALLKTLEEPPAHVIFILATTEVHKLPATILSRCQRFDFKRIDSKIIRERLKIVAKSEDFRITDDAADIISSLADGGMRDALSTLDLCASASRDIDEEIVVKTCGMASNEYLLKMADCIIEFNAQSALLLNNEIYNASVDMLKLLSDMILHFRNLMIIKTVKSENKPIVCSPSHFEKLEAQAEKCNIQTIMSVLRILQDTMAKMQSGNRRTEMELMLIQLCSPRLRIDSASLEQRIAIIEQAISSGLSAGENKSENQITSQTRSESQTKIIVNSDSKEPENIQKTELSDYQKSPREKNEDNIKTKTVNLSEITSDALNTVTMQAVPESISKAITAVNKDEWNEILNELSKSVPLLSGILHNSSAYIDGSRMLIESENPQFCDMMNASGGIYRDKLRKAVGTVLGESYSLGPYRKQVSESHDPLNALKAKLKSLEVPNKHNNI